MNLFIFMVFSILFFYNYFYQGDPEFKQVAEKVYLHIDREIFDFDDDIWFKAYVIDPSTNKFSKNTSNLHVELISPTSEIVQNRIVRMGNGIGNGDFQLIDSLRSGKYIIRAYTNHMRNYDDKFFYTKEITIINPYDENQELNHNTQNIENKVEISFFPEGGSLVNNVTSTVAFKAINAFGKGCDVTVELYSSSGELLTIFNSTHLGMGFFNLKPVPGLTYYTITKSMDGSQTRTDLPKSFTTGVAISTLVTDDKKLILTVNTNEKTLPMIIGKEFTVSLSSRNLINKITKIKIDSLVNNFLMPVEGLPDGIIRVTLSENGELPLCERLVYLDKNEEVRLNIATDKIEYKPHEKVNVKLSLTSDSSLHIGGSFSFSAAEERFTANLSNYPTTISSWFLLESDIHGPVEKPSYYFDPANKKRLADLDILLMTQGWRDFKWKYDSLSAYKHEIGFTITGKVKRIAGNNPIKNAKVNMVLYGNCLTHAMVSETDTSGFFKFEGLDLIGTGTMIISATDKRSRTYGNLFVDSLSYKPAEISERIPKLSYQILQPETITELKQEAIVKLTNRKKYKLSDTIIIGEVIITANRPVTPQEIKVKQIRQVYREPDKELFVPPEMDNFSGDVFDFMAGRIPSLRVVRSGDDVKVFIRGQKTKNPDNPDEYLGALILLDGREIERDNMAYIFILPTSIIDRIDVLNASSAYGVRGANGIVNIITRTGMRRDTDEKLFNTTNITIHGFNSPRIFYAPKYNTPQSPSDPPDNRSTIFWEPNITVDKNGNKEIEYYNADNPTLINITVEGITEDGILISSRTNYRVK